jgi:hypothetical protein
MPSAWPVSKIPILFRPVYTNTGSSTELLFADSTSRTALKYHGQSPATCYLRPAPAEDDQIVQAARLLLDRLERIEGYLQQLAK